MPKKFRLKPKTDDSKLFRPPSRLKKIEQREKRWSPEYREARGIRDSGRWKKLRDRMVRQNPMCERCNISPTKECHHITPLVEDASGAYDKRNLVCLCLACHQIAHQRDRMNDSIRDQLKHLANTREDDYGLQ